MPARTLLEEIRGLEGHFGLIVRAEDSGSRSGNRPARIEKEEKGWLSILSAKFRTRILHGFF